MMRAFQPRLMARWGWGLVIFGLPWSHAAMSIGTAWVTVCALMTWGLRGFAISPYPRIGTSPWLWLTLLLGWETASLAWSENVTWGLHQLSIQLSFFALAFTWLQVPLDDRKTSDMGVPKCSLGHDWGVGLGRLAHPGWRRPGRSGMDPMDVPHSTVSSHCDGIGLGDQQPRFQRLVYLLLWVAFTAVTGSLTSALLMMFSLGWMVWNGTHGILRKRLATALFTGSLGLMVAAAQWLQIVPSLLP